MKRLILLTILVLIRCSSTKNVSEKNNTYIDKVRFENQELKEELSSLKREIQVLSEQQREYTYTQRKRNQYPETLSVWIKIKNGKIHSNKIGYYNLPGRIIFDNIEKLSNGQSIIYLKSTHTNAQWYFYIPQKDGEYNITSQLRE